ncbi:unnamed protein product, partial [Amoebophrya sp. A25]|eukprot:GSA25T00017867001.1
MRHHKEKEGVARFAREVKPPTAPPQRAATGVARQPRPDTVSGKRVKKPALASSGLS